MGDSDEVGHSVRESKTFLIRVWKHHPHDLDAAVMLHELEVTKAWIQQGVVIVTRNDMPTHWIRLWDYVEITEATTPRPEGTDR